MRGYQRASFVNRMLYFKKTREKATERNYMTYRSESRVYSSQDTQEADRLGQPYTPLPESSGYMTYRAQRLRIYTRGRTLAYAAHLPLQSLG